MPTPKPKNEWPDITTGSKLARKVRKECNTLTAEQRVVLMAKGMAIIDQGKNEWPCRHIKWTEFWKYDRHNRNFSYARFYWANLKNNLVPRSWKQCPICGATRPGKGKKK